MILILIEGIISCLISLCLRFLYTSTVKYDSDMKKRCIATANSTFVAFAKKEIRSHFDGPPIYNKYFFPIYEYYVNGNRYEVQSSNGIGKDDESLIEKNKLVYYNPNKYEESFVKEDISEGFKTIKMLEIIFFALGLFFIILYFLLIFGVN